MKIGDYILLSIAVVFTAFTVIFSINKPAAAFVCVYEDSGLLYRCPLNEDAQLRIVNSRGEYNLMEIKNGSVSVKEADCRNQVCVHTAAVSHIGDSIICLPHRISIVLEKE